MENLTLLSDKELFEKLKQSNLSAFKIIYHRYFESLYKFAYFRMYSHEDAQDIVQEVFVQFWDKRYKITIKKSVKAYLYRMVNNFIINDQKKKNKVTYFNSLQTAYDNSCYNPIDDHLDIELAIRNLPEKIQLVYILKSFQGLLNREIAEACNISIKTVEARITKAYKIGCFI